MANTTGMPYLGENAVTTLVQLTKAGLKDKLDKTSVVNNLTSTDSDKALSAAQGKALADLIADAGYGDMLKSIYDANDDGVVDNASKLGNHDPDYFAKASDVPQKVGDLTNDAGYQTSAQVESAITEKGYQTAAQVESAITGKGYQTASDVETAITGKGYQTAAQVESAITGKGYQTASDVNTAINAAVSSVYKPQGSSAFADLPAAPDSTMSGFVYNVTDAFTTDAKFVEGAGHKYPAGTNVVVAAHDGGYSYDVLSGTYDFSHFVKDDDLSEITSTRVQEIWDSVT